MSDTTRGQVTLALSDSSASVTLAGVIDVELARGLHRAAREASGAGRDVVIDAGDADYLDASALQLLVALRHALAGVGTTLRFGCISPPARKCCELAGLWAELGGDSR